MSTDENRALAFRYFDQRWNHSNDAVIDELLGEGMSPEEEKAHIEATHTAFGDIELASLRIVDGKIIRFDGFSEYSKRSREFLEPGTAASFAL